MATKLTQAEKKRYVDNGGKNCPYCNAENIKATESMTVEDGVGTQGIICCSCDEEWTDVFRLVNVPDDYAGE